MHTANRLRDIRTRERVAPRTMGRRLDKTAGEYALLESPDHELTVRELIDCCEVLGVPPREFFDDEELVPVRANVLRAYKSALTLKRIATTNAQKVIVDRLCEDLLKLVPEMAGVRDDQHTGVNGWNAVGHRRGPDEISMREEFPVSSVVLGLSVPIPEFAK